MRRMFWTCFPLAAIAIAVLITPSSAGNKWMMEKNGDEMIMLNRMLLQRLGTIRKDGRIILSGDVIHDNGKVVIRLYELQQPDLESEEDILSPEIFDRDLPYQIFLREEILSELPPKIEMKEN